MRSRSVRPMKRAGYTLFEMLMVQALLVAMVAASWPALRSPLGKSQLVDAARQLRVELIKARHKAIETGVAQQFRYQPGAGVYEITPAGKSKSKDPLHVAATTKRPSGKSGKSLSTDEEFAAICRELPAEVSFADLCARADDVSDGSPVLEANHTARDPWSVGDEEWSSPVVFHPNGRTSNAKICLRGASDFEIEVSLRGLTGIASIGEVHRIVEAKR